MLWKNYIEHIEQSSSVFHKKAQHVYPKDSPCDCRDHEDVVLLHLNKNRPKSWRHAPIETRRASMGFFGPKSQTPKNLKPKNISKPKTLHYLH